jgi:hypothetical protein
MSTTATTNVPARHRRGRRLVAATLLASAATIMTLLFDPTPALAKPKQPPNTGVTCARQEGGEWNFYLPGERVYGTYGELIECGTDGLWHAVRA